MWCEWRWTTWLNRIAHVSLILWFGCLSPLIYIESYSSHQQVVAFRTHLLSQTDQLQQLRQIWPEIFAQTSATDYAGSIAGPAVASSLAESAAHWTRQPLTQPISHFFLALIYEAAPTNATLLIDLSASASRLLINQQPLQAVDLPVPDKPPPFLPLS